MTRSQTIAALIITTAVALLVALFFLRDGPDQVDSLSEGDEASEANAQAGEGDDEAGEGAADEDADEDGDEAGDREGSE